MVYRNVPHRRTLPQCPRTHPIPAHSHLTTKDMTTPKRTGERIDASVELEGTAAETLARDSSAGDDIGIGKRSTQGRTGNKLFSAIYLSPDYHRFHSPTNWVLEKRRHFMGDACARSCTCFSPSVTPYFYSHHRSPCQI